MKVSRGFSSLYLQDQALCLAHNSCSAQILVIWNEQKDGIGHVMDTC